MLNHFGVAHCSKEFLSAVKDFIEPGKASYFYHTTHTQKQLFQNEFSVFIEACVHAGLLEQRGREVGFSKRGRQAFALYGKNAFRAPYYQTLNRISSQNL